jgi:hypothetical protein
VEGVRVGVFRSGAGHGVQRREFFDPSRHLFRVHLSGPLAIVSLMVVRMSCAVVGDRKSRVRDVSAGAAIVVAAVGVQRIFASHMPKPQSPSVIPTA